MRTRDFGRLGTVSALALGGGGIGAVWGDTSRDEAIATVQQAIDGGITLLDLAPTYGPDHEAERVAGAALRARPAPDVLVLSKVELPDDDVDDIPARMTSSLQGSLQRLGRDHLDLFVLHSQLRAPGYTGRGPRLLAWQRYLDDVIPVFERLVAAGTIRGWGLTGVGHPDAVVDALRQEHRPDVVQTVVNAMDLSGDMWLMGDDAAPRNDDIRQTAAQVQVPLMAIRVVAAGSLTDALDRELPPDHPAAVDFRRAEPFRRLAADLGESAASLAHRYALSVPGVATVSLGVKNRAELTECLAAEEQGPLDAAQLQAVHELR